MGDESKSWYVDSTRLKQVNLEVGRLASRHRACRLNSGLFSGLGAVLLALSLLGLVRLLPAGAGDWTQNPDSPVYAIAAQDQSGSVLLAVLVGVGFVAGLALLYNARLQCARQRKLWQQEGDLRKEMRELRDKLYILDKHEAAGEPRHKHHPGHTTPLDPGAARDEYVGVYNPPVAPPSPSPERV